VQTIVINLPSDDSRWVDVRRQFFRAGLRPVFHEATDGRELSPEERGRLYSEDLNRRQYHRPLGPGEIGCYASHLSVWKQFLDSPHRHVAIFEDDIEIDPDLAHLLDAIRRSPVEGDLIKLIGRSHEKVHERLPLMPGRELIRYRRVPSLTGAYVLTRRGAEKLIAARQPFGRPVDVDIRHWWECDLEVLGVDPYPVRVAPASRWTTIADRDIRPSVLNRIAKLHLQARYSLFNWCSLQGGRPTGPGGERRFGLGERLSRHDAA
jgi:glycosyl transferase family 25